MSKNIKCVIGANFGDEGKGLMTDYFTENPGLSIVVLHNGGAQRGHTVTTKDGKHHVFHHLGSGTFTGAPTFIADTFVVNPILFNQEYAELKRKYPDCHIEVYMDRNCVMTTLYDMLVNQVIEIDRGSAKHGSCGAGIYETLYRNQFGVNFKNKISIQPYKLTVGEFYDMNYLQRLDFLNAIKSYYTEKRFNELRLNKDHELIHKVLNSDIGIMNFLADFEFMINHITFCDFDYIYKHADNLIFENGQGLLLDQHNMDYYPHLTPSNTGMRNPAILLASVGCHEEVEACYVSRSYMTRHGVGRFDTECPKGEINRSIIDTTNVPNPFQDSLRYGKLDSADLFKRCYYDAFDSSADLNIKVTIAMTHVNEYNDYIMPKATTYISSSKTRDGVRKIFNSYPLILF